MDLKKLKIFMLTTIFLSFITESHQSRIVIDSLTIRHLKKNDIGLIFDAAVVNKPTEYKETLNFEIRASNCCLLINGSYDCDTQNLYGAKISNLEPNKQTIVSLIWPTLIPYNRIGNCTVNVLTHRLNGIHIDDTRMIHFNTTIDSERIKDFVMYYFNYMKDKYGYTKCKSDDLNPFDNCNPLNCELKYFGKRNFFKYPSCVPVEACKNDPNVIYDYETNECKNLKEIFSEDEIRKLKEGHFSNWIERFEEVHENDTKILKSRQKEKLLRRVRRSLNESQTFADMIIASMLLIIKIAVLVLFIYLMMAFLISILFYLCIGCGIISNSVTMNVFERV